MKSLMLALLLLSQLSVALAEDDCIAINEDVFAIQIVGAKKIFTATGSAPIIENERTDRSTGIAYFDRNGITRIRTYEYMRVVDIFSKSGGYQTSLSSMSSFAGTFTGLYRLLNKATDKCPARLVFGKQFNNLVSARNTCDNQQ
jgi:hypothetical protein